ncbi:hypothetical protein [Streptomyces sp. NPDC057052]|uniref:hypothetical protein n=1 Tax=Streptomyces sp. NPDC057052 TaxID=3346010 RepID=UPI0036436F30
MSARLIPKDIVSVDKTVGRNLGPPTAVDAEVRIDEEGRVVRVRQEIYFASGPYIRGVLTLDDFKSVVSVSAPVARRGPSRPRWSLTVPGSFRPSSGSLLLSSALWPA